MQRLKHHISLPHDELICGLGAKTNFSQTFINHLFGNPRFQDWSVVAGMPSQNYCKTCDGGIPGKLRKFRWDVFSFLCVPCVSGANIFWVANMGRIFSGWRIWGVGSGGVVNSGRIYLWVFVNSSRMSCVVGVVCAP